jgi:hypothetical protein
LGNATLGQNIISGKGIRGMKGERKEKSMIRKLMKEAVAEEQAHKREGELHTQEGLAHHREGEVMEHEVELAKRLIHHHHINGGSFVPAGGSIYPAGTGLHHHHHHHGGALTDDIWNTLKSIGKNVKKYVPKEAVKAGLTAAATAGGTMFGNPALGAMAAPFISKAVDFGYDYTPNTSSLKEQLTEFAEDPLVHKYAQQFAPEVYGKVQHAKSMYDTYAPTLQQAYHNPQEFAMTQLQQHPVYQQYAPMAQQALYNPQEFAMKQIQQQPIYQDTMAQLNAAKSVATSYANQFENKQAPPLYNYSNPYAMFGSGMKSKKSRVGKDHKHKIGKGSSATTSLPYHEAMTQSKVVSGGALIKKHHPHSHHYEVISGSSGSMRPITPAPSLPVGCMVQLGSPYQRIDSPAMSPFIMEGNQYQGYSPLNKHTRVSMK